MALAPTNVVLSSSATSISATWTASVRNTPQAGAITYDIQRQANFNSFGTVVTGQSSTSYFASGLVAGNSYRIQVRSRETSPGQTVLSSYTVSNRVYLAANAPTTVSLGGVSGDTEAARASILVTWTAMNGANSYDVERRESSNGGATYGDWSRVSNGIQVNTTTYGGLNRGSTYLFRVRTNSTGGVSGFRTAGDSFTLLTVRPSSVTASLASDTSIRVTWPASNGATSYRVQVSVNGGGYSNVETTSSRDRTYSGLNRGSTYRYRVFSINSRGDSPTAREADSVLVPFPPPPRPANVYLTKTKRDIRVTFDLSTPPAGTTILNYEIEIRADGGSYGSRRTDNGSGETYTNLNPGSTYQARVRAIGQGGASDWRESGTSTISPPPSIPSFINAQRVPATRNVFVELGTSTAASDVTISGYEIQRRESTNAGATWGDWGFPVTTNTTDITTTYTDLNVVSTYEFRGRALSDFNPGDFIVSDPVLIPGLPAPPQQVLVFQEGASVRVILTTPISDGGIPILTYRIEKRVSEDLGFNWETWGDAVIVPASETVYLYNNLELQKTYQFRALATNDEGDSQTFTESDTVYLPAIVKIFENGQFRFPNDYKRYDSQVGWIGISTAKRFVNGQWFNLT